MLNGASHHKFKVYARLAACLLGYEYWAMFSPESNFDVPLAFHPVPLSVSESASDVLFEKTILTASGLFVSVDDWDNKNFKW